MKVGLMQVSSRKSPTSLSSSRAAVRGGAQSTPRDTQMLKKINNLNRAEETFRVNYVYNT
jgi:hypothetical protein